MLTASVLAPHLLQSTVACTSCRWCWYWDLRTGSPQTVQGQRWRLQCTACTVKLADDTSFLLHRRKNSVTNNCRRVKHIKHSIHSGNSSKQCGFSSASQHALKNLNRIVRKTNVIPGQIVYCSALLHNPHSSTTVPAQLLLRSCSSTAAPALLLYPHSRIA